MTDHNLKITGVTIKNFLSIGNATQALKLDEHGLTLVLGNNGDANGVPTKNGAGKSTILQAISFGLYGQPLTKIKIPNLVNNINGKAMHVVIDFEKNGIKYRIERGRNPTIMKWYVNGEEIKDDNTNDAKGENSETQVDINRIIGMSHTMFKHIVALNTYTDPFLKTPALKQREIVEELFGVMQISAKADRLKIDITKTKDRVKDLEAHVSATKAANLRIEASIEKARATASEWEKKQEDLIATKKSVLETLSGIDFDAELKIFDAIDEYRNQSQSLGNLLNVTETEISQLTRKAADIVAAMGRTDNIDTGATAIARIERDIERQRGYKEKAEADLVRHTEQVNHFKSLLENPGEQDCKTCGQTLQGTDHLQYVIQRFNEELEKNEAAVSKDSAAIEQSLAEIATMEAEIETIKADAIKTKEAADAEKLRLIAEQTSTAELLDKAKNKKEEIDADIAALNGCPKSDFSNRDQVYSFKQEKESLDKEIERLEAEDNPYIAQINGLRAAIQPINMQPINDETKLLKHQEFLFKLLTSKDSFIRRKIIDQNLAFLNSRLNQYLNKLGLPHEVVFLSDLSVDIMLLGRDMDYEQLSRGESNRVIMAMSWAFRDVWESLNHRVNIMWLDELIDSGLDSSGAESALQILKGFARAGRNVFLISHRDELIGRIDRTLLVSKENGFTSISEQE